MKYISVQQFNFCKITQCPIQWVPVLKWLVLHEADRHLQLMPRLGMDEAIVPSPHMLSWCA